MIHENSIERRTEVVLPNETNSFGALFGGKPVAMMDSVAGIAAVSACRKPVVTASIEKIDVEDPIRVNEFVETIATVGRIGRTSIEVEA